MKKKWNLLVVISAPSGAGKTTLCRKLLADFPELTLSISSTTRAPRGTEREGIEYFFLSREDFEKWLEQRYRDQTATQETQTVEQGESE